MKLGIGEIFERGLKLSGVEQIAFFRNNYSTVLGKMVQYALDPYYVWDLPEGKPPFNENKYLDQESNLYAEARRLYMFFAPHQQLEKHGGHVPPLKKEINYIALLETVSPLDAAFLLTIKDKKLPGDLTALDIQRIYPGLLRQEVLDLALAGNEPEPKPATVKRKAATGTKKPAATKTTAKKKPAAKKPATGSKRSSTRKAKEE